MAAPTRKGNWDDLMDEALDEDHEEQTIALRTLKKRLAKAINTLDGEVDDPRSAKLPALKALVDVAETLVGSPDDEEMAAHLRTEAHLLRVPNMRGQLLRDPYRSRVREQLIQGEIIDRPRFASVDIQMALPEAAAPVAASANTSRVDTFTGADHILTDDEKRSNKISLLNSQGRAESTETISVLEGLVDVDFIEFDSHGNPLRARRTSISATSKPAPNTAPESNGTVTRKGPVPVKDGNVKKGEVDIAEGLKNPLLEAEHDEDGKVVGFKVKPRTRLVERIRG